MHGSDALHLVTVDKDRSIQLDGTLVVQSQCHGGLFVMPLLDRGIRGPLLHDVKTP